MRQTDVHMGREEMGKWINIDDLPSGRVEWDDIFDAPSIDIVRCGECKSYDTEAYQNGYGYCSNHMSVLEDNDFCSRGERREP